MDGLAEQLTTMVSATRQRTIKTSIGCVGTGLHTGHKVRLTLRPAPVGHGIVFRRTDLNIDIPARFDAVIDTRLCTVLGSAEHPHARVGTVEHLMAAISGQGIDNLLVEVSGAEVPIFDGSAASCAFLLECAGVMEQDASRPAIEILRTVRVEDGEAFAELRPSTFGFDLAVSIDFAASAIGRQALSLRLTPDAFGRELSRARTFALAQDIEALQAAGLARGGSLSNAIVVDGGRVLNPGGLRMADEFVRHKMLDAVGDLALAGAPLRGRFIGHRCGHRLNNRVLRALFSDPTAWRRTDPDATTSWSSVELSQAA